MAEEPVRSRVLPAVLAGASLVFAARQLLRRRRYQSLDGKVVLLTGGSRGLGLVMARKLADRGASLVICGRDEQTLHRAHADLLRHSPNVLAIPADVTEARGIDLLVRAVNEQFGPVDVLINNVAEIGVGPAAQFDELEFRNTMETILWSAYRLTEAVLPGMRERGGGRICNISSVGGLVPMPHLAPYVTAKHALTGYSRVMHNELRREGIFVTTVNPGLMRTGSPRNIDLKGQARREYAWFKIADSLPGMSMSAQRAAEKIVSAIEYADADVTLGLAAQVGAHVQALFPNGSAVFGDALNRVLPGATLFDHTSKGRDAESSLTRSPLTALTDRAARANNEMGG